MRIKMTFFDLKWAIYGAFGVSYSAWSFFNEVTHLFDFYIPLKGLTALVVALICGIYYHIRVKNDGSKPDACAF